MRIYKLHSSGNTATGETITVTKNGMTRSCREITDSSSGSVPGVKAKFKSLWDNWSPHPIFWNGVVTEPQFSTIRSRMMIHYGRKSKGCITVTNTLRGAGIRI